MRSPLEPMAQHVHLHHSTVFLFNGEIFGIRGGSDSMVHLGDLSYPKNDPLLFQAPTLFRKDRLDTEWLREEIDLSLGTTDFDERLHGPMQHLEDPMAFIHYCPTHCWILVCRDALGSQSLCVGA